MPFSFGFILKFMESASLGPEEKGEEGSYCQQKPLDSPFERNKYKLTLQKTKWRTTSCWKPISKVRSKSDLFTEHLVFHTEDPSSPISAIWDERPITRCLRMTKSKPFTARVSQDEETTASNTDEKTAECI